MEFSIKLQEKTGKSYLSYSSVKNALTDMRAFELYMAGKLRKESPALTFGSMYDMMLFEPDKAKATYQVIDHDEIMEKMSDRVKALKNPKSSSEYKAAVQQLKTEAIEEDRQLVDESEWKTAHLNFMSTNMVRNNPVVMASIQKNILEHISIMAQEQVQIEFREQMMQMQSLQQQAPTNPQAAQMLQQMMQTIEARKAVLIAEMTEDFMKEENKITSQFDSDPLLKLKSREVDLRAMENERKKDNDQAQQELARARLLQSKDNFEDKLEQNEDLAKLRAGVSLAKSGVNKCLLLTKINGILV